MNHIFKESIQPIGECGIAFAANGKLFTAGHVVSEIDSGRFHFRSKLYNLSSPVFHSYDTEQNETNGLDVTIYDFDQESSLEMSLIELTPGAEVER